MAFYIYVMFSSDHWSFNDKSLIFLNQDPGIALKLVWSVKLIPYSVS